jgi:cellulose synthase/poly-beta-1,6-N-acetylglucosamine synthase-like glycosyltransferase
VIIPAWNEAAALPKTLATVLAQDDLPESIIISDDGSTDETIAILVALYDIEFQGNLGRSRVHPNLQLLAKAHSGKGDSINQAVNLSNADVVLILDADTRIYPGSIRALRYSFTCHPSLSAVSGTLIPSCSDSRRGRWFQFLQRYEYARQHLSRLAWSYLNSTLIIPGACSAFRRDLLLEIGGFCLDSWGEDYEIMYRLQRHLRLHQRPCRVMVQPDLCVETDAPETLYSLLRQRRRWAAGFLDTLLKYRQMVGDRRFGILGCGYLVHNTLTISTPIDSLGWLVAGFILSFNTAQTPDYPIEIAIIATALSVLTSSLAINAYRHYFSHYEVSPIGAIFDLLLRPVFYLPVTAISQLWGYISYLRRQKSW